MSIEQNTTSFKHLLTCYRRQWKIFYIFLLSQDSPFKLLILTFIFHDISQSFMDFISYKLPSQMSFDEEKMFKDVIWTTEHHAAVLLLSISALTLPWREEHSFRLKLWNWLECLLGYALVIEKKHLNSIPGTTSFYFID